MRDLEIKFRHIVHNREEGIKKLLEYTEKSLKRILDKRNFYEYKIPNICDGFKKDTRGNLLVCYRDSEIFWNSSSCPLSNKQKLRLLVTRLSKKSRVTLKNIIEAYNKGLSGLVRDAEKEYSKYFKPGMYISCNIPEICDGFGCSSTNNYYITQKGKKISWLGEESPLTDTQRMKIYNILKDIIY